MSRKQRHLLTPEGLSVALHWGRCDGIFDSKESHFATVPMILYLPKVSSEHLVDDCGTSVNHHRDDPKVTCMSRGQMPDILVDDERGEM